MTMKRVNRLSAACAVGILAISQHCAASPLAAAAAEGFTRMFADGAAIPKAASAQTLGARGTVTSNATLYGGFEVTTAALVYVLVRGNSLGTLGITQNYLDLPRLRLFDVAGNDIAFDANGNPGFAFCLTTGAASGPVRSYYATRGAASDFDACTSRSLSAGVYTFSVTPSSNSVPTFGEVLFEVKLNP